MNLQQLNGSGQGLWDFLITAVLALVITGATWWVIEQLNSLRAWRRRDRQTYKPPRKNEPDKRRSPDYSLLVRLTMITWLITHGHWSWMIKSGAGWCVLTNSSAEKVAPGSWNDGHFAGDVLSHVIGPHAWIAFQSPSGWWPVISSRDDSTKDSSSEGASV